MRHESLYGHWAIIVCRGVRYELTHTSRLNNTDRVQDISYDVAFNMLINYFAITENVTLLP